jgi:hypothetical protein
MDEPAKYAYDVFISYSHDDRGWVRAELLPRLEAAGLKVCIDYRDFKVGVPSAENIEHAIDDSRHTLLVLTPAWAESEWTDFESLLVQMADPAGRLRKLIPLLLKPCQLPRRIGALTYADFTEIARREEEMTRLLSGLGISAARSKRVFISYKRDADPDEAVAKEILEALSGQHEVFIDRMMPVGTNWPERLKAEIEQSDYLVLLLSEKSVHSQPLQWEVETAHNVAALRGGSPTMLPVRLNYPEDFEYPLSEYLKPLHWTVWSGPNDTPRIIEELQQAIAGGGLPMDNRAKMDGIVQGARQAKLPWPSPAAQPMRLEEPGSVVDLESRFYVQRSGDSTALELIQKQKYGVTIVIKGPHQIGKSSLLYRTNRTAAKAGKQVAFLDFQLLDSATLTSPEIFFRRFCIWLTDELQADRRIEGCWDKELGLSLSSTKYVRDHILAKSQGRVVLAMDDVDRIFGTPFCDDFFNMLRSWINSRANQDNPMSKLDLVLVTSTEPYEFLPNLDRSPFNVGEIIRLEDFTLDQVGDLNRRHGSPLQPDEVERLCRLLGGHPYLVRRALYFVASRRMSAADLFARATEDGGPFGDHLRYHLLRICERGDLLRGLRETISRNACSDSLVFWRLQGAGLVREEDDRVVFRCPLYAEFFKDRLSA